MKRSRMNLVLAGAAIACTLLLATSTQASLVGVLEQISPTAITYTQGTTGEDPPPAGIDFTTFQDFGGAASNTAFGDITGNLQYVPGLGDDPQDFIDAGFIAGNIAIIDRGAVNFTTKIINAAGAGAIGAIIANTSPSGGGLFEGGMPDLTTIPAVMVTYALGQDFITGLGGGSIEVHMSVSEPPRDSVLPVGPGMWDTRIIAIDDQNGATDHDINSTEEAMGILAFADGGPNSGGWNIRYDVSESRNLVDMAGGGGTFANNHPYPNGETEPANSPGNGEDFLVTAEATVNIPEGDWTIAFGRDDGGALRMPGTTFTAEFGTDAGDTGLDDTIVFNGTGGHNWTAGEFTVGPGGMVAEIEAIMFERGGGDSFEIAIAQGHMGNGVSNTGEWVTLRDGALGWSVVPEPSTWMLAMIGLFTIGLLRRKFA